MGWDKQVDFFARRRIGIGNGVQGVLPKGNVPLTQGNAAEIAAAAKPAAVSPQVFVLHGHASMQSPRAPLGTGFASQQWHGRR